MRPLRQNRAKRDSGQIRRSTLPTIADLGTGPPVAAVTGLGPVVAHDVHITLGDHVGTAERVRLQGRARKRLRAQSRREPRLGEQRAVDEHVPVGQRHRLARKADHPLDQVGHRWSGTVLVRGRIEDDDVAGADAVEVEGELVDHDAIADLQCGLHRARRDGVRRHDEGPEQNGDHHRRHQDSDQLEDPTGRGRLVPGQGLGGSGEVGAGWRGLLDGHDQEYYARTGAAGDAPGAALSRRRERMTAWFGPSSSTSTARSPAGRMAAPPTPASSPTMATGRTQAFSTATSLATTGSSTASTRSARRPTNSGSGRACAN